MKKKGLLVASTFCWAALVCSMTYIVAIKQEKKEIIANLFSDLEGVKEQIVPQKEFSVPYHCYVKANGKIVPPTGYIKISNPIEGVVEKVFVKVGDSVRENEPLFKIKDSVLYVEIKEAEARLDKAVAMLEFRRKGASKYALLSKQKEIEEIILKKTGQEKEFQIFQNLLEQSAVSSIETDEKNLLLQITEKALDRAKIEYEDLKGELSLEEEDIYLNEIEEKKAALKLSTLKLESSLVKAPISALVSKISVSEGQFVNSKGKCGVTLVKESPSMIKVSISEEEAYKIKKGKSLRAIAIHPENPDLYFLLEYVTYNPKISIYKNGKSALELYFSFNKEETPLYLEQALTVYIETNNPLNLSLLHHKFGS